MKNSKSTTIIAFILALIPIIAYVLLYSSLPEQIPIHFNVYGEVDNYGSKNEVFMLSALPLVLVILFYILPKVDPKKENFKKFDMFYGRFKIFIIIFLDIVFAITMITALELFTVNISLVMLLVLGLLFIFIGNYLPKAKQNYTFGIRTAWTLSSEEVWLKTHRFGGKAFVACGIISMLCILLPAPANFTVFIATMIITTTVIFISSYFFYKNVNK